MYEITVDLTIRDLADNERGYSEHKKQLRFLTETKENAENLRQMDQLELLQFLRKFDNSIYFSSELYYEISCKPFDPFPDLLERINMYEINIYVSVQDLNLDGEYDYIDRDIRLIAKSKEAAEKAIKHMKQLTEHQMLHYLHKFDPGVPLFGELFCEIDYKPLEIDFE